MFPFQPMRIGVYYWKEKIPGEFRDYPAFIEPGACGNVDSYALPSFTYPGLIKVNSFIFKIKNNISNIF